ncbi:hypothetical protein IW261DRAFT_912826 [Armillaria novae-zelandiae]|uniref:Xylanolytic transcriptional activator regulatory domain-containing protein n=1 Tax=Armillaria novae-zelandiae TaxID=153914 RepID=A0AA39TV92_9AGAR|nr:hypothetical protein IW261DRAFT_912826 [Armillaria novae-zelandiae]
MKCDFPPDEKVCKRCKPKGSRCIVEAPKPKVYERERLLSEIRQKDAIIENLLKQLYNPYLATSHSIDEYRKSIPPSDANNPSTLAWLDRLKSSIQIGTGISSNPPHGEDEEANEEGTDRLLHEKQHNFFSYGDWEAHKHERMRVAFDESLYVHVRFVPNFPRFTNSKGKEKGCEVVQHSIARHCEACEDSSEHGFSLCPKELNSPDILALGLVTLEDAEHLFDTFYTYIHPFIAILDPVLFTPKSTLARCPVLFTVICAIASRYYPPKSSIYPIAMHFAKHSAAKALIHDETRSVELCQAYILMSSYVVSERSWEKDLNWLYTGLAISIATALRLDQIPKINPATENEEREYLNRLRVWQLCFQIDRGAAVQYGRPWMMEDIIIRHSAEWYEQSHYALDYDVHTWGYSTLLLIVTRFHKEDFSGQDGLINSARENLRDVTMRYDVEIEILEEQWKREFKVGGDYQHGSMLRCGLLHLLVAYSRLVMFSFGFHHVFHTGMEAWYDYFFNKSLKYATLVIRCITEDLAPSGFMRGATDRHFMCAAFAAVFIFKLLRPEFSSLMKNADKHESINLVATLINKFSSSDIAVDDRHTPKLYARFLAALLSNYRHKISHEKAVSDLQTAPIKNTDILTYIVDGGMSDDCRNYRQSPILQDQEYDSSGRQWPQPQILTYQPEVTHATGVWPQFGDSMEFPYGTNDGENVGNGERGSEGGMSEDEVLALMQGLIHPEWFGGVLMPGFT